MARMTSSPGGDSHGWAAREARRIEKARTLLRPAVAGLTGVWADLGCGDGIFTSALHTLLDASSEIYAVDRDRRALRAISRNFAESYPEARLQMIHADFTRGVSLPLLDGLLMANALHFVQDKEALLRDLAKQLAPGGRLIVVEYNTARGNFAVPHPIDDAGFVRLATQVGLREARIVARIPSRFLGEMYAGMALTAL